MSMKLIILFLIVIAGKAFSNNEEVSRTLASVWEKTSTNNSNIRFSRFGSIISETYILVESANLGSLENIGVAYGLYDATKVNIGKLDTPKEIINSDPEYVSLLKMEKIWCKTRLVCVPSFFNFKDEKPIIGSFIESGELKTFDVSMIEKSPCDTKLDDTVIDGMDICLKREKIITSSATPFLWFNPKNKIWYLVGVQWYAEHSTVEIGAYNISYFQPWIKKTVEEGSMDALQSSC